MTHEQMRRLAERIVLALMTEDHAAALRADPDTGCTIPRDLWVMGRSDFAANAALFRQHQTMHTNLAAGWLSNTQCVQAILLEAL